jgi:hypothetical protein
MLWNKKKNAIKITNYDYPISAPSSITSTFKY